MQGKRGHCQEGVRWIGKPIRVRHSVDMQTSCDSENSFLLISELTGRRGKHARKEGALLEKKGVR